MKKVKTITFDQFAKQFPPLELPITLSEESHRHFSQLNKPLPNQMIQQFLEPLQKEASDEYTEYLACFSIKEAKNFHGLVYWKAGLLTYEYILATFTKKGVLIDQQSIAGTRADGDLIARTVATIDDEWNIFIVGGVAKADNIDYDGTMSESIQFTLQDNGQIQAIVT